MCWDHDVNLVEWCKFKLYVGRCLNLLKDYNVWLAYMIGLCARFMCLMLGLQCIWQVLSFCTSRILDYRNEIVLRSKQSYQDKVIIIMQLDVGGCLPPSPNGKKIHLFNKTLKFQTLLNRSSFSWNLGVSFFYIVVVVLNFTIRDFQL